MENMFSAKKRNTDGDSCCLAARKRIRAIHPLGLDLNLPPPPEAEENEQKPIEINEEEEQNPEAVHPEAAALEKSNTEDEDEDGILCAVCEDTNAKPTNQIVFCDGCNISVHQRCYGNPLRGRLPTKDEPWFCNECIESPGSEISCCLCHVPGGALKRTRDGQWAHLLCAIWVPEVFFHDWEGREGIDCSHVLKSRWGKKCCVCGSRTGCSVQCSELGCPMAFHVTCGWKQDFSFTYDKGKGKKKDVIAAFCKPHTQLWEKQEHTGKYKIVAKEDIEK